MAKIVKGIAAFSLAATVILAISYKVTSSGILLPLPLPAEPSPTILLCG